MPEITQRTRYNNIKQKQKCVITQLANTQEKKRYNGVPRFVYKLQTFKVKFLHFINSCVCMLEFSGISSNQLAQYSSYVRGAAAYIYCIKYIYHCFDCSISLILFFSELWDLKNLETQMISELKFQRGDQGNQVRKVLQYTCSIVYNINI